MTTALKLRRGTTSQHSSFTGAAGEVTVDTTKNTAVIHNGSTAGGFPLVGEKGNQTISGTKTFTNDASISGLTVGKGGGAGATNTAIGLNALVANTTGTQNTSVGAQAGDSITTGNFNVAFGTDALGASTTANQQTALGWKALESTTGEGNTGVGSQSLRSNTTGTFNTSVGREALYSNTTASNNTAVGFQAGYSTTTGSTNTFIGQTAGLYNTTGSSNLCVGAGAGLTNQAGLANTFIGVNAGFTSNAGGSGGANTCLGYQSGYFLTTGTSNTFLGSTLIANGYGSGYFMTTGSKNTIVGNYTGNQGGLDIRTASNYIVLSDGDGNPRGWWDSAGVFITTSRGADYATRTRITGSGGVGWNGVYEQATGTPFYAYFVYNNSNVGNINGTSSSTVYATSSDQRLKENIVDAPSALAKIDAIKIRSFDWINTKENVDFGVIAQELYQVAPNAVSVGIDNEDGTIDKPWGVDVSFLVPALIKAVQELNAKLEAQALEIATLKGQ